MVSDKKILWEFPIGSCVKLSSAVAVILVGVLKCQTQFWKGTTQGSFQQSLVEIGSAVLEEKNFFNFIPLFSILSLAAILVGSRDHRTQIWKAATQGSFQQSLVEIGSLVLEEKIFIKFNTSSESSGRSAPRTFSKYIEIVSLSTTHFVLRVGFTAD
jgi:hypothetical protein